MNVQPVMWTLLGGALTACAPDSGRAPKAPASAVAAKKLNGQDVRDQNLGADMTMLSSTGARLPLHTPGKVTVLVPGYTHCPDVCAVSLQAYKDALKRSSALRANTEIRFVSLDAARDTPALLKKYLALFDADFVGFSPTPEELRRFQAAWGVRHERTGQGGDYLVNHTDGQMILDRAGRTVVYEPFGQTADALAADLNAVAAP